MAAGGGNESLVQQAEELAKQRAAFQKTGNIKGEAAALMSLTTVRLLLADLKDALEASTAVRSITRKAKDVEGELSQLLIGGHLSLVMGETQQARDMVDEGRKLCNKARDTKFAEPARGALNSLAIVTSMMDGFSLDQELAAAAALCAFSHIHVTYGNFQAALPAAKEAVDAFEARGNRRGVGAAALALAQAHVQAGQAEDKLRQRMFLLPATHHAAAAGAAASKAKEIAVALGAQQAAAAAQVILDMERVRMCLHMRNTKFSYETWNAVNP